jgi:predicted nucleic acid-binding protein
VSVPFIDTDVIIRFLTGDDPEKQAAPQALFERIERGDLVAPFPNTVIADAVYVLSSKRLYDRSKPEVAELLIPLVSLPGLRISNRRAIISALRLFSAQSKLDFTDALLVTLMQQEGSGVVYSYDTDYDGVAGVTRQEP